MSFSEVVDFFYILTMFAIFGVLAGLWVVWLMFAYPIIWLSQKCNKKTQGE